MKRILLFIAFTVSALAVYSQEDTDNDEVGALFDLPLEELMNMQVSVASKNTTPLRQSPGIVSVLTESEIEHSGARDLIDLLRLVPGMEFGAEWDQIIGLGVRGNNATEGKALILIDGHQLNETNYGIFPFGRHILTQNIKQIEIIRGPGSAQYGGAAELAVINIITKKGEDINGVEVSTGYGYSHNATSTMNVQGNIGKTFKNGLDVSFAGGYSESVRSNLELTMRDNTIINYAKNSDIESMNFNMGLRYKGLNVSALFDKFQCQNTDAQGDVVFQGLMASASYRWSLTDNLTLVPEISTMHQLPWYFVNFEEKEIYNTKNQRYTGSLTGFYDFNSKIQLVAGAGYFTDASEKETDGQVFNNNKQRINYNNFFTFLEGNFTPEFANITAGARFDNHSEYGSAFVPRIAFTKVFKKFHFKLLASRAFKAPTIANIDLNSYIAALYPEQKIEPEKTTVYEVEAGYQFSKQIFIVANFFDITIKDPIFWAPPPTDTYINWSETGSRGVEISCKFKPEWGAITSTYAYYNVSGNKVPYYEVEGENGIYGAFPQHRASVYANVRIAPKFYISPTVHFFGERFTYIHNTPDWSGADLVKYDNELMAHLFLSYHISDFTISAGVYDMFDSQYHYINSYQSWQNPIPDTGREFVIKLAYRSKL